MMIEHHWQSTDRRRIGIGNISLAGGGPYKGHDGHKSGRDVDIRPMRKDGKEEGISRFDGQYDQESTARLIGMFFESPLIKVIFFNDPTIPSVRPLKRHDDHFHITIKE
jgi:penicillin-insensitive murein endopeptidase